MLMGLPNSARAESAPYNVTVECESNEHYTNGGEFTYYTITITNNGTEDDTYDLTYNLPPSTWSHNLNVSSVFIPAGESRNVTLKVAPGTCGCEYGTSASVNVTATSQSNITVSDKVETITTFMIAGVTLKAPVDYLEMGIGDTQTIEIIIMNECNLEDTFTLFLSNSSGISAELDNYTVSLRGNASGTFNLTVSMPESGMGQYHQVRIMAQSLHDESAVDNLVLPTFLHYMVTVDCEKNELYTEKNVFTFYTITVSNLGTKDDTYTITYDEPPSTWTAQLNETTLFLPAGQSKNITFGVKPSCDCDYAKSTIIEVKVTSNTEENVSDKVRTITTFITTGVSLSSQVEFIEIGVGGWQTVEIDIENLCWLNDTFLLSLSPSQGVFGELSSDSITMSGNSSSSFELSVSIPKPKNDEIYHINITATSLHDGSKSDTHSMPAFVLYMVSVECENNEHFTVKDVYTYYTIKVNNIGQEDDNYYLNHDWAPTGWSAFLSPSNLSVPMGESRNATLKVKPNDIEEYGNAISIEVWATSQSNINVTDSVITITTYIISGLSIGSEIEYFDIGKGENRTIEITLENKGEFPDTYLLQVSTSTNANVSLDSTTITVWGKSTTKFNLTISIPQSFTDTSCQINITAISWHSPTQSDTLFITANVITPDSDPNKNKGSFSLPVWILVLVGIIIAILVLFILIKKKNVLSRNK
jgi:uncharacterized membrane protein